MLTRFAAFLVRATCTLGLMLAASAVASAEPVLDIKVDALSKQWTRSALLQHVHLRTITVNDDVAYHQTMHYQAIALRELIGDASTLAQLKFVASDGFVATIPGQLLASSAEPYLAVEAADHPWPALRPGGPSAGPFYLVWLAPARAKVSPEQWPYQIARIEHSTALHERYPQLLPKVADNTPAMRGLQQYEKHCAVCHALDGGGDARIGPDLNRPYSPTEYFQEAYLRKLIRNPADVRQWPNRSMPGFGPEVIDESQLDDLLAYLRHMATQRRP